MPQVPAPSYILSTTLLQSLHQHSLTLDILLTSLEMATQKMTSKSIAASLRSASTTTALRPGQASGFATLANFKTPTINNEPNVRKAEQLLFKWTAIADLAIETLRKGLDRSHKARRRRPSPPIASAPASSNRSRGKRAANEEDLPAAHTVFTQRLNRFLVQRYCRRCTECY